MPRARIDSKKIAKALGADTIISGEKQARDGRYYMEFISFIIPTSLKKNVYTTKRRIYQLDENSVKKYTLLGTAEGEDFYHCLLLASQYGEKGCLKRICGYCVETPEHRAPLCRIAISFYAKK